MAPRSTTTATTLAPFWHPRNVALNTDGLVFSTFGLFLSQDISANQLIGISVLYIVHSYHVPRYSCIVVLCGIPLLRSCTSPCSVVPSGAYVAGLWDCGQ